MFYVPGYPIVSADKWASGRKNHNSLISIEKSTTVSVSPFAAWLLL
jgi:hypothetical protein